MALTPCSDPGPNHHERRSPDPVRLLLLGLGARRFLPGGHLALPRARRLAGHQAPPHRTLGTGTLQQHARDSHSRYYQLIELFSNWEFTVW